MWNLIRYCHTGLRQAWDHPACGYLICCRSAAVWIMIKKHTSSLRRCLVNYAYVPHASSRKHILVKDELYNLIIRKSQPRTELKSRPISRCARSEERRPVHVLIGSWFSCIYVLSIPGILDGILGHSIKLQVIQRGGLLDYNNDEESTSKSCSSRIKYSRCTSTLALYTRLGYFITTPMRNSTYLYFVTNQLQSCLLYGHRSHDRSPCELWRPQTWGGQNDRHNCSRILHKKSCGCHMQIPSNNKLGGLTRRMLGVAGCGYEPNTPIVPQFYKWSPICRELTFLFRHLIYYKSQINFGDGTKGNA